MASWYETYKDHERVDGVAYIGSGTKAHPARAVIVDSAPGKPWNRRRYLIESINCSCGGTSSGAAYHKARFVLNGERTCERRA